MNDGMAKEVPVTAGRMPEVTLAGTLEFSLGFLPDNLNGPLAVHHSHNAVRRQMDVSCVQVRRG